MPSPHSLITTSLANGTDKTAPFPLTFYVHTHVSVANSPILLLALLTRNICKNIFISLSFSLILSFL